jgi:fructose-1,6-bisphosphatase/inositol monophosphatase family enzyme
MLPDSDKVARLIAEIAAEEVMPYFEKLGHDDIREKKPGDLVTIADVAAERRLTPLLSDLLPGSRVVGEEAVAADPGVLDALAGTAPVWLVDPIDGTANFAAGTPIFAVMVALVREGQTVMGWIHEPVTRRTASAVLGEGAWRDGQRLRIAAATGLPPRRLGNHRLVRRLDGRSDLVDEVFEFRCAGHEYVMLASGAAQFALYNRLLPWDHAPGHLLHREAGGFSARLDGSPYTPRDATPGLLLAPDAESWKTLREALIVAS